MNFNKDLIVMEVLQRYNPISNFIYELNIYGKTKISLLIKIKRKKLQKNV